MLILNKGQEWLYATCMGYKKNLDLGNKNINVYSYSEMLWKRQNPWFGYTVGEI